jgi:hypothetical protein
LVESAFRELDVVVLIHEFRSVGQR